MGIDTHLAGKVADVSHQKRGIIDQSHAGQEGRDTRYLIEAAPPHVPAETGKRQ